MMQICHKESGAVHSVWATQEERCLRSMKGGSDVLAVSES